MIPESLSLLYMSGELDDLANGIAVDRAGAIYVAGETNSGGFLGSSEYHGGTCGYGYSYSCSDIFVARLTRGPTGLGIDYRTLLGGSQDDRGYGIAVDAAGDAYVAGMADNGAHAYVARLHWDSTNHLLSQVYAVTLAGDGSAVAYDVAVDANQNAVIVGETYDFTAYDPNVYVAKLNPTGAYVWQQSFGGSNSDRAVSVAIDQQQQVYLSGDTHSMADFPTVNPLPVSYPGISSEGGEFIAFAAMLTNDGAPIYRTRIAGDTGYGIAVDSEGRAYIATNRVIWYDDGSDQYLGVALAIEPAGAAWGYDQPLDMYGAVAVALDAGANAYVAGAGAVAKVGDNPLPALVDTDGDALPDEWEINGYRYTDADGVTRFVDLPAMGADPLHKDMFVEIDYMGRSGLFGGHNHKPDPAALDLVIQAFADAPISNPDGQDGIALHIDAGSDSIMNPRTGELWGARSRSQEIAHDNSSTVNDCNTPGISQPSEIQAIWKANFVPARVPVFHYTVFAHQYAPGPGAGESCIPFVENPTTSSGFNSTFQDGSAIVVSLGAHPDPHGTVIEQAGTFMHELGHDLKLDHGGPVGSDQVGMQYKPNYLSVMNYAFQMGTLRQQQFVVEGPEVSFYPVIDTHDTTRRRLMKTFSMSASYYLAVMRWSSIGVTFQTVNLSHIRQALTGIVTVMPKTVDLKGM